MNILIGCLLIAIFLPYLVKLFIGYAMQKQPGGYDNYHPRQQQANLEGFGARAVAAHQNCFESLIIFASAVLMALATAHVSSTMQILAMIYIGSRFIYIFFYLKNWASLRSTIWLIGLLCCITMISLCFS